MAQSESRPRAIIDIQEQLAAGKGEGYRRWATVENLKRLAKTKLYMDEHHLDYDSMQLRQQELTAQERQMTERIDALQSGLSEVDTLKKHVISYVRTRKVFEEYKKSGYSRRFLEDQEDEIAIHREAKRAFDERCLHKLPTVKSLQEEGAALAAERRELYAQRKQIRRELRELAVHRANCDSMKEIDTESATNHSR